MIVPITRSSLQSLKAETDEEHRLSAIEEFTTVLYKNAIRHATKSNDPVYIFEIGVFHPSITSAFIKENKEDVLRILQPLFPDSIVEYKTMIKNNSSKAQHEKLYFHISTADEHIIPLMTAHSIVDCIVIDWS